jgi:CubicO group peptidase (beta-lactamase class C family)
MTQHPFKFSLLLSALLLAGNGMAQEHNQLTARTKTVIDSSFTAWLKKYKIIGTSIAIVDKGQIVYATGYGFSDQAGQTPATAKTIFRIGSCTKSFTALSLMQMQERKQIDINRSIKDYLTDLKLQSRFNDNNPLYINELLSHTSGMPCDVANGFFCDAPPDISWVIQELNKQTTMSPRRYKMAYSNIAYGLCGELIARTNHSSYSDYVKKNIFAPLNMTSSYIETDGQLAGGFSKAYCDKKEIKEPQIREQAAGLIHSNALDMGNYLLMYLNNGQFNNTRVVSAESLKEMEKNQLQGLTLAEGQNWGYGLYTEKIKVKKDQDSSVVNLVGHGGDTYAFHADFGFIPELNVGAVVLTNTDRGSSIADAGPLLRMYLKETYGKKITLKYKDPADSLLLKTTDQPCSPDEIKGNYNMNEMFVRVTNVKKIKFKQGPATVVLKQLKTQPGSYSVKAVLYKVIPIKVKSQQVKFVKLNDEVYMKGLSTKSKRETYMAKKSMLNPIPASWKAHYGKYTLTGTTYACTGCPFMNPEGLSITLSEKKGVLVMKTKGKTRDMNNMNHLEVISEQMCVTGGIGRGTGETIRILDNGNIYYSGFEFKKVK